MNELLRFKISLQEYQRQERKHLELLQKEINKAKKERDIKKWIKLICNENDFPILSKEFILYRELLNDLDGFNEKEFNIDYFLDSTYKYEYKRYIMYQRIIEAIEIDKIINYIDLEVLIMAFGKLKINIKDASVILGMAIVYNKCYISKKGNRDIKLEVGLGNLINYYNKDGSFKYNPDVEIFSFFIHFLLDGLEKEMTVLSTISFIGEDVLNEYNNDINKFINGLMELLRKSNEEYEFNSTEEVVVSDIKPIDKDNSVLREDLEELREYYKRGSLLRIPSDMDYFNELLDRCKIDIHEKRFIYSLINEELQRKRKDNNVNEESNNELDNDNNLIFLCNRDYVPFLLGDIDYLENKNKKLVFKCLKKIKKNNQRKFKKVLTRLNNKYKLYIVNCSKIRVAFIELLDSGLYLVVGACTKNEDLDSLVYRVISHESEIGNIFLSVKEGNVDSLIEDNKKYLELFEKIELDITRVLVK